MVDPKSIPCSGAPGCVCPACYPQGWPELLTPGQLAEALRLLAWEEPQVPRLPLRLAPGLAERDARIRKLEMERDRLIVALRDCAAHEVNADTCGVCGEHFTDCEAAQQCTDDEVDEHDISTGREPACPGARARVLLAAIVSPT